MIAVIIIPKSMFPGTLRTISAAVIISPTNSRIITGLVKSPNPTIVEGLAIIMPPLVNPITAIKSPTPALRAAFKDGGIALIMILLIFVRVTRRAMQPEIKTTPRATCQVRPMVPQSVNAKKAFNPIPGARAKG